MYPIDTSQKYPLISFSHGYNAGGKTLETHYKPFWELIVSAGYVIAAQSAPNGMAYCKDEWKDQLQVLRWAQSAPELKDHVDFSSPTILMGHSMGGRATVIAASQRDALIELNVSTAVAQHPSVNVGGCPDCDPAVPIMFVSGSKDTTVPPKNVKAQYDSTQGVPKAYVELEGAVHTDPEENNANLEDHYVLDWLNCFIKANSTACSLVKCGESQETSPTSACEHEGLPDFAVV